MPTTGVSIKPVLYRDFRQYVLGRTRGIKKGFATRVDEGYVAIDRDIGRYEVLVGNPTERHYGFNHKTLQVDIDSGRNNSRLKLILTCDNDELEFTTPAGNTKVNRHLEVNARAGTMLMGIEPTENDLEGMNWRYYIASLRVLENLVSKEE